MSVHTHTLDIYGVRLYLATNRREWATLRRKFDWLDKQPNSAGLAHFGLWVPKVGVSVPHLVFWLEMASLSEPAELVDTIAHEATHGANQILGHIGHEIHGSDEPHAYLVGWLTAWMYRHVT